jgi:asparagine synthase (glutamine-hydrolysing)
LDTLNPGVLRASGLFQPGVLERWMADHLEGRVNIGFHLWGLMILFLWMEKWQIQSPCQEAEASQEALLEKTPS